MLTSWVGKSHHHKCWFRGANAECCATHFTERPVTDNHRSYDSSWHKSSPSHQVRKPETASPARDQSPQQSASCNPPRQQNHAAERITGCAFLHQGQQRCRRAILLKRTRMQLV